MLELSLRLRIFIVANQNGSATPANETEGHYFVLFLANIL